MMIKMMKHPDFKEDYDVVDKLNDNRKGQESIVGLTEEEEIERADNEEAQEMLDFKKEEERARWHI